MGKYKQMSFSIKQEKNKPFPKTLSDFRVYW